MNATSASCAAFSLSTFAFNLFAKLAQSGVQDTNVLISPFSIASALAMIQAGTRKDSIANVEFQSILGSSSHLEISSLSKQISSVESTSTAVQLIAANGIWSKSLRESYVKSITDDHDALAADLPSTFEPIDKFIATKTNGMLQNVVQGTIDPLTVAILVNAVFFKGKWTHPFDPNKTVNGVFTTSSGYEKELPFMKMERQLKVSMNSSILNGAHIVQLDYGNTDTIVDSNANAEFAAFFILPSHPGSQSMNDVISSLVQLGCESASNNSGGIQNLISSLHELKVEIRVPRFKLSYGTKSVSKEIQEMGLKSVFMDGSLPEMSHDPLVHLDDVLHKAVIEVTEEGTVAAAATVGIVMTRMIPIPSPEIYFDRPFLLMIFHIPTNTPLFLSKVCDPEFMAA
jgi:serpin B